MKILYICTHNRCRSILFEAITNSIAGDLITAKSAGSQPVGEVHPLTLKYLTQTGHATAGLTSQSWHDFPNFEPDLVITVCDAAAAEACPVYFGASRKLHWGLADPSKITGSELQIEQAFLACIDEITKRVEMLKAIAAQQLSSSELTSALAVIGTD